MVAFEATAVRFVGSSPTPVGIILINGSIFDDYAFSHFTGSNPVSPVCCLPSTEPPINIGEVLNSVLPYSVER